jgi:hypothetical protein
VTAVTGSSLRRTSWWGDAFRGAVAGAAATWLMDLVTTGVQAEQSSADQAREAAARPNGQSSMANLVDRVDEAMGLGLDRRAKDRAASALHYGLGIVPGAIYGAARARMPLVGAWRGLLYGAALFAVNDELLNTQLGLAGPLDAYPASSHWRGAIGHLALGAATDTGLDVRGAAQG